MAAAFHLQAACPHAAPGTKQSERNMKKVLGPLLLLLLGAAAIGAYYFLRPILLKKGLYHTSDPRAAATVTLHIGGDGYLGYWFLTSPEMKKQAASHGVAVSFTDDGGDYPGRLQKLAQRELDLIVLPVNSYLLHGAPHQFPGVIIAAIAESKGADGIVGFADKFPTGTVKELNNPALKIVHTPKSPSSFLLDLTIVDFDLFNLANSDAWRVEVGGSTEAYKRCKKHDGDAFVLWEPELSKALAEDKTLKAIWGSDKFAGYIVDVFVVNREFLRAHEPAVLEFMDSYFTVLRSYANNHDKLLDDIKMTTGLGREVTGSILPKIEWFDLYANCQQEFGIKANPGLPATEGVVNTIIACTEVLVRSKAVDKDPLEGNPYTILYPKLLETLSARSPAMAGHTDSGPIKFAHLDEEGWSKLREIGAMRVEPITFRSGDNLLDDAGKDAVDKIAPLLVNNFPNLRVAVRGHTGPGAEEENVQLSLERAEVVVQRLVSVHGIDPDRLHAEGWGSKQPPPRKPGESERALRYRMARVEFVLLEGNHL
jgi:outer membrane protein OmpA-like peptidoglycan-associated protein